MIWEELTNFLKPTGIEDVTVWQDIAVSSVVIPITLLLMTKLLEWWNKLRPSRSIFKGYLSENKDVYVFHSEMSVANDDWSKNPEPKYISFFPSPTPTNHNNLNIQRKLNIDLVSSVADGECVADIFNILGQVRKTKRIHLGDTIKDWHKWSTPIFSVGFNPKTEKLLKKCDPIYFELVNNSHGLTLKNDSIVLDDQSPNDAGIIQKTFDCESKVPVFILAGIGTTGTSAAGHVLKENYVKLGRLYGNRPFCLLFRVKLDEGKQSAQIKRIMPQPKWYVYILHPITILTFKNRGYF